MIEKRKLLTATDVECEVGGSTFRERLHRRRYAVLANVVAFGLIWGVMGAVMLGSPDPTPGQAARLPALLRVLMDHPVAFLVGSFLFVMAIQIGWLTGRPDWTPEKVDERNAEALAALEAAR